MAPGGGGRPRGAEGSVAPGALTGGTGRGSPRFVPPLRRRCGAFPGPEERAVEPSLPAVPPEAAAVGRVVVGNLRGSLGRGGSGPPCRRPPGCLRPLCRRAAGLGAAAGRAALPGGDSPGEPGGHGRLGPGGSERWEGELFRNIPTEVPLRKVTRER